MLLSGANRWLVGCTNTDSPGSWCLMTAGLAKREGSGLRFPEFFLSGNTVEPLHPFLEVKRATSNLFVLICSLLSHLMVLMLDIVAVFFCPAIKRVDYISYTSPVAFCMKRHLGKIATMTTQNTSSHPPSVFGSSWCSILPFLYCFYIKDTC